MIVVIVVRPGPQSEYWISRNMEWVLLTRDIMTIAFNILAVYFYVCTQSDRQAILRFSKYMIAIYSAMAVARGCQLSVEYSVSNFGICSLDLSELVHFFSFAPVGGSLVIVTACACRTVWSDVVWWCVWTGGVSDSEEGLSVLEH